MAARRESPAGIGHGLAEQAELALRNTEKLALVGRLSASIAHEINNPLEAITNLLYLLEQEELTPQARSYLKMAQGELLRVVHITTQTLGFSRRSKVAAKADARDLMEAALTLYRGRLATAGVHVRKEMAEKAEILCNATEVRQVFANLIGNAMDAMPTGGRLWLCMRKTVDWNTGEPGVRVTVADTGVGMTKETERRMFEPFYTTKGEGGTGLGLWVTDEIVTQHHGRLRVKSRVGAGTVFGLFLPEKA